MTTHAQARSISIWDPKIVRRAIWDSLRKLHPRTMARNPVMFVVEVGSVLTTWHLLKDVLSGAGGLAFEFQITFWQSSSASFTPSPSRESPRCCFPSRPTVS